MSKKDKIIEWLKDYKERTHCTGVVLGISGGKDSTTVAMLAKKVWGDNVLGVLMPNGTQADLEDSSEIVRILNLPHKVVNIGSMFRAFEELNLDITDKAKTNVPPRLRMLTLYAIAQSSGYRVMGTGNASERFIGWFTKWGDGAFDFNPIANLTCGEVIELGLELCKEFGLPEKYIVKTPADGLTGKSDEENFGFGYARLDSIIKSQTEHREIAKDETYEKIMKLHKMTEHKRREPEVFDNRKD